MATQKPKVCANCGGTEFVMGNLVWNAPIRFKTPDQGTFRRGSVTDAWACEACGHIALFVEPPGS